MKPPLFLRRALLAALWYVYPPVTLLAQGAPEEVLALLGAAVKPNQKQLHLQELFAQGRRYHLNPRKRGFVLMTTSKAYWRYTEGLLRVQRRTRSAARVVGVLSELGDDYTRIELRANIRPGYLLDVIWIPLFFSSIVVFMPWHWLAIGLIVALLFGLSYTYHRYHAAFQANEMMFFVEKVLQSRLVKTLPTIDTTASRVVRPNAEFEAEWERFYDAHRPTDEG